MLVDSGFVAVDVKTQAATESSETSTPAINGAITHEVEGSGPGTPPNMNVESRNQASPRDSSGEGGLHVVCACSIVGIVFCLQCLQWVQEGLLSVLIIVQSIPLYPVVPRLVRNQFTVSGMTCNLIIVVGAVPDSWEDLEGNGIAPEGSAAAAHPEVDASEVHLKSFDMVL